MLSMYNPAPLCAIHKASIVLLDRSGPAEKVRKKQHPTKVSKGKSAGNRGVDGGKKGRTKGQAQGKKSSKRKG